MSPSWTVLQAVIWIGSRDYSAVAEYDAQLGDDAGAQNAVERALHARAASRLFDHATSKDGISPNLVPIQVAEAELMRALDLSEIQAYCTDGTLVSRGLLATTELISMRGATWRLSRQDILKLWPAVSDQIGAVAKADNASDHGAFERTKQVLRPTEAAPESEKEGSGAMGSARPTGNKRGPLRHKEDATVRRMLRDYMGDPSRLGSETQEVLASIYKVSRGTADKARKRALPELAQQNTDKL
jgi:hypothetical protein